MNKIELIIDKSILIQAMYKALRLYKEDFNEDDYFWRIGIKVFNELTPQYRHLLYREEGETPTLYGISVEIDYINIENIRLYEDITYKIGESEE